MRLLKLLFLIIISAAFAAFAVSNRHDAAVNLFPFPYSLDMPIFLLALLCVAAGAAVAWLVMLASYVQRSRELRAARQRIMALENEIGGMKTERQSIVPASHDRR